MDSDKLNERLANSAGYGADRFAITMNQVNDQGETKSVLDGRLVLADRATTAEDAVGATDPTYYVNANGMEFDLSTIRDADCMNGGFGPFGTATIAGVAWNDANYDGIRDYVTSLDVPEEGDEGEDGEPAKPTPPTSVVNLEEPLVGETVYLTQEYLDPTTNKWVFNPDFGGALDPKVGDLSATDKSVTVRTVTANTEYSISGFVDGDGNPAEIWFTEPHDPNLDNQTVFPWPGEPGEFTDGMTVTTTDEDGNEVTYTLTVTPNTEYKVTCRQKGSDGSYAVSKTPVYVATRGESKLADVAFAEGEMMATATKIMFTEKPLWWRDLADPDLATADEQEGWNGWEYAAVPVDATDDDIEALDSSAWFHKNAAGLVTIDNLTQRTHYRVVARIRAFDEFDLPDVAAKAAEDAVAELEALGLVVETAQEHTDAVPNGAVIRTEPAAGATAKPGMTVKVIVSSGPRQPVTVPDVTGLDFEAAKEALTAAGLKVSAQVPTEEFSDEVAAGLVLSTSPAVDAEVLEETEVRLVLSKGPEPVEPTEPTEPGESTDPSEPTDPTDPSEPTDPTEPGQGEDGDNAGGDEGDGSDTGDTGEGEGSDAGTTEPSQGEGAEAGTDPLAGAAAAFNLMRVAGSPLFTATSFPTIAPLAAGVHSRYEDVDENGAVRTLKTLAMIQGEATGYVPEGATDPQKPEKPAPPGSRRAETDKEGIYRFDDLQVYVQKNKSGKLVSYETPGATDEVMQTRYIAYMAELNGGYVMSRYNVPGTTSGDDSDLTRNEEGSLTLRQAVTYENGMTINDGYVYLNHETANEPGSVYGSQYDEDAKWKPAETTGDTWAENRDEGTKTVTFDVPAPYNAKMDAGAKAPNLDTVSGIVWNDANNNGIREAGEEGIVGAAVELTRYWYDTETNTWVFDDEYNRLVDENGQVAQSGDALVYLPGDRSERTNRMVTTTSFDRRVRTGTTEEMKTYPQGYYSFEDLPSTEVRIVRNAEVDVVYGYRVNIVNIPANFAVSKMNRGEDILVDSDLNESTTRLMPEGEVAVDGLMVLALPANEADAPESKIEGPDGGEWSTLGSQSSANNDAGLVPFDTVSFGGHVWMDANKDGIQAETDELVVGKELVLERQAATFGTALAAGWMSRITDGATGSDLDASGEPLEGTERYEDIQWVIDRLDVAKPEEPVAPEEPTDPEQPGDGDAEDPDEGVEAPTEPEGPVQPEAPSDPDAGAVTPGEGDIANPLASVFADETADDVATDPAEGTPGTDEGDAGATPADPKPGTDDADGAEDDGLTAEQRAAAERREKLLSFDVADPSADLERVENDGILSEGAWETVAITQTDLEGSYLFAGQPAVDEFGRPYVYRVRMEKPADAEWVPLNVGKDDNVDNDVAHMNLRGQEAEANSGVTEPMTVLSKRSAPNAYGLAYQVLAAQSWTRETKHAVDPGYYIEPEPLPTTGPVVDPKTDNWTTNLFTSDWMTKLVKHLLPQTGDTTSLLRLILALIAGFAALMLLLSLLSRRREEEQARGTWGVIV